MKYFRILVFLLLAVPLLLSIPPDPDNPPPPPPDTSGGSNCSGTYWAVYTERNYPCFINSTTIGNKVLCSLDFVSNCDYYECCY